MTESLAIAHDKSTWYTKSSTETGLRLMWCSDTTWLNVTADMMDMEWSNFRLQCLFNLMWYWFTLNDSWCKVWLWCFTRPISRSLVSITTMVELCSHNILQKSSVVSANGPWVAMYAFCCLQIGTETVCDYSSGFSSTAPMWIQFQLSSLPAQVVVAAWHYTVIKIQVMACRSVLEQDAEPRIVPHRTTKCC